MYSLDSTEIISYSEIYQVVNWYTLAIRWYQTREKKIWKFLHRWKSTVFGIHVLVAVIVDLVNFSEIVKVLNELSVSAIVINEEAINGIFSFTFQFVLII